MQLRPWPPRSRPAASLAASLLMLFIGPVLSPRAALASQIDDVARGHGHDHHHGAPPWPPSVPDRPAAMSYQPDFASPDRGILGTAAPGLPVVLSSNMPVRVSLEPGHATHFVFVPPARGSSSSTGPDDGPDSPVRTTVFLSANTCSRPDGDGDGDGGAPVPAPQLQLVVATAAGDIHPGLSRDPGKIVRDFDEGAVMHAHDAAGNVYFAVRAPEVSPRPGGAYVVEIAASLDTWFHSYDDAHPASVLDWAGSDSNAALLVTRDAGLDDVPGDWHAGMREAIRDDPPYVLFAEKKGSSALDGISHSYCGLQKYAAVAATRPTLSSPSPGPRHRFHFRGLDRASAYDGILVHTGRKSLAKRTAGQAGAGGRVFRARQFETTTGDNCRVITDLPFCDMVDYAVPANDNSFNGSDALGKFYDDYARKMYGFFKTSLAQTPCEAPDEARYSLVWGCSDCEAAYKKWLCAVAIPRCEDFTSANPFSRVRNVAQAFPNGTALDAALAAAFTDPSARASRNAVIDREVKPGPYREVLPCEGICYRVVQSCPSALGFTCPQPGMTGYNQSYGTIRRSDDGLSCNYPGGNPDGSSASRATRTPLLWLCAVFVVGQNWL